MARLSEEDVDRRLPLWVALAELFLDGGADKLGEEIVRTAKAGGFSLEDVKRILHEEVGPVFYHNHLAIAGHWGAWGDDFVREKITAYLASGKRPGWLTRPVVRRVSDSAISEDWPVIEAGLAPTGTPAP